MHLRFCSALLFTSLFCVPAIADDAAPGIVDSVVLGVLAHEVLNDAEGGVDGNLELRLRPLFGRDWSVEVLPTIGGTANSEGDTNTAYAGATARYRFMDNFFIEGFFGLTVHDGVIPGSRDSLDLGCTLLFREAAGIGYQSGPHMVSLFASHSSHGDLICDSDANDGISSVGMRYGYQF